VSIWTKLISSFESTGLKYELSVPIEWFRLGVAVEAMGLCRWVDGLGVFLVREELVYEDVRCVGCVLSEEFCDFFPTVDVVFDFSNVGSSGRSSSLQLAGLDSCSTVSVDFVVCSVSAGGDSVCRVVEALLDSSDVPEDAGSGAGYDCREERDEITVYRIIIVPATIPAVAYQRPGGERRPSTNRRAAPQKTTRRAP
jgi:hypothetical protein